VTGAVRTFLLAAAIAAATWAGGWSGVPLVAFLWGAWRRDEPLVAFGAGVAAIVGWVILLGISALSAPLFAVADRIGGVAGVDGAFVFVMALIFAFGLAWSAAALGGMLMLIAVRPRDGDE
jgi:hypothetical protein